MWSVTRSVAACLASVMLAALAFTGCADSGAVTTSSTPSPSVASSTTEQAVDPEDPGDTGAPATWDAPSRSAVVEAAEVAMKAYARPDLSQKEWFAALEPLLTYDTAVEYASVDPKTIRASRVTGPGIITFDESAYVAGVDVPTNADSYEVLLSRQHADDAWLVVSITRVENPV